MSAAPFFPHFHFPITVLPLPQLSPGQQAGSGCCLLELWSQPVLSFANRNVLTGISTATKSDLKFGGVVCTQLSESRMISGKPVIYSTSLLCGFCFLSPSQF